MSASSMGFCCHPEPCVKFILIITAVKPKKATNMIKKSNVKEPFTHFFLFPSTSTQKDRKKRTEMKYNVVCICMNITTTKKNLYT